MKRSFLVIAFAGIAACAHGSSSSAGAAPSSSAAGAVAPSELSPEQIRVVQRSLADRGFAVPLTGTFDESTRSAVTDFQRARGLATTGSLDTATIESLGIDPRTVMPARGAAQSGQGMMDQENTTDQGDTAEPHGDEMAAPGEPSAGQIGPGTSY
jgi:hypothetical protein